MLSPAEPLDSPWYRGVWIEKMRNWDMKNRDVDEGKERDTE